MELQSQAHSVLNLSSAVPKWHLALSDLAALFSLHNIYRLYQSGAWKWLSNLCIENTGIVILNSSECTAFEHLV